MTRQIVHLNTPGIKIEKFAGGATRRITAIASTEALDRSGDSISVSGWQLENYRKNPVVLSGHDPLRPVGRATRVWVESGALRCIIEFPEKGSNPRSDAVWRDVEQRILNGISVGFLAIEGTPLKNGWRYTAVELLELSIVSIPANAQCLITRREEIQSRGAPAVGPNNAHRPPCVPLPASTPEAIMSRATARWRGDTALALRATQASKNGRPKLAAALQQLRDAKRGDGQSLAQLSTLAEDTAFPRRAAAARAVLDAKRKDLATVAPETPTDRRRLLVDRLAAGFSSSDAELLDWISER